MCAGFSAINLVNANMYLQHVNSKVNEVTSWQRIHLNNSSPALYVYFFSNHCNTY